METPEQFTSIAEATKKIFLQNPEMPIESINEYLAQSNLSADEIKNLNLSKRDEKLMTISPEDVEAIKNKFRSSPRYYMQFQEAILHMSCIIRIVFEKANDPLKDVDLDQPLKDVFAFASDDDKDIYRMRMFYMNQLNAHYMQVGYINPKEWEKITDPQEREAIMQDVESKQDMYDDLLNSIKKKYRDLKSHLA